MTDARPAIGETVASGADTRPQQRRGAMLVLLGLAAVVGVVVSLVAWGFLELIPAGAAMSPPRPQGRWGAHPAD